MKRLFLMVFLLLTLSGEAQAVLQYKDEVESFFAGRSISMFIDITFVEYSCEIPEGFKIKEVLTSGGGLTFGSGVGTGVDVYAKYLGKSGSVTSWEVLKLTRSTCDEQSSCDQYKELFNPPAPDCNFEIALIRKCIDGEGNVAYSVYEVKSSDGRSTFSYDGDTDVECASSVIDTNCSGDACFKPFVPDDEPGTKVDDPVGDIPNIFINIGDGSGGDDGGGDDGGGGGGNTGGGDDGGGGGGNTGGGDDGGGGGGNTGGGGGIIGGGGNGKDYTSILNDIKDQLNGLNEALNGKGDGLGPWSGDGGLGSLDGVEGMNKGEEDLKGTLDGLMNAINNNETVRLIKGHRYIQTSSPVCTYSFSIWGHTQKISFCEYESILRKLGHVLLGLVTVMGFVHVVREV